jgi:hypothetical protein
MAAKASAAKKTAKGVKNSKTTKANSGFTSAQNQAYRAAYTAAVKNANLRAKANTLAKRRLQSSAALAAKRIQAVANRTKPSGIRATYLQAKYGAQYLGPIGYPVRRRLFSQKSTTAYLQSRYGKQTFRFTAQTSRITRYPKRKKGRVVAAAKPAVRKSVTGRTAYATSVGRIAARRVPAKQKVVSKTRTASGLTPAVNAEWITAGNDLGIDNCVAVAIANHRLLHTGHRLTDDVIRDMDHFAGRRLDFAIYCLYWDRLLFDEFRIEDYDSVDPIKACPGLIVGFDTPRGPHCGVLLPDNKVISWGEVIPLDAEIEEAWFVKWTVTR